MPAFTGISCHISHVYFIFSDQLFLKINKKVASVTVYFFSNVYFSQLGGVFSQNHDKTTQKMQIKM